MRQGAAYRTKNFCTAACCIPSFFANVQSTKLVLNLDFQDFHFPYVDAKLIIRSVLEKVITQRFLMTDPKRLSVLFVTWQSIEAKRYHTAFQEIERMNPNSTAITAEFLAYQEPWSAEKEKECTEAKQEWEAHVTPSQSADKARTWSGISLGQMASRCNMADWYALMYRANSWYTHGLGATANFFFRPLPNEPNKVRYSAIPGLIDKIECYLQIEKLLAESLQVTGDALNWKLDGELKHLQDLNVSPFAWIAELARH